MFLGRIVSIEFLVGVIGCATAMLGGCASSRGGSVPESAKALFLHLPGIEGQTKVDSWWMGGLRQGGLDAHMEVINWTGGRSGIAALQAYQENRDEARRIAARLTREFESAPRRPIILSANSGGVGVAIWALEALPADVQIQTLLLTAPAISPSYDLTRALSHIRDKAVVFYSDNDDLILGAGTRTFGTIDGLHCDAAGLVGFHRPASGDPRQYAKLRPIPYRSEWVAYGNWGDHTGDLARPFAEHVIAPMLKQTIWQNPSVSGRYF